MDRDEIIIEIINAYSGYPDQTKLSKSTRNFLKKLDEKSCRNLFNSIETELLRTEALVWEKLTLAILHWQAINNKSSTPLIPDYAINNIGVDKYTQCKSISAAAGRIDKVLKKDIVGTSEVMLNVKKQTWMACFGNDLTNSFFYKPAIKNLNVLILGETGTGKELFAKAVHSSAYWHNKTIHAPSASVNVAAFTDNLIDSELFGHKRGAFTGAINDRIGLITKSNGGTFFLDEVGDLPLGTQVKLLRVIETKKVRPVGVDTEVNADVRYISATNKMDIPNDDFRSDLYERLAGTIIYLPPLRERSENDINQIVQRIVINSMDEGFLFSDVNVVLDKINKYKKGYNWPGNVRELQSFVRGVLLGIVDENDKWRSTNNYNRKEFSEEIPDQIIKGAWSEKKVRDWYTEKVMNNTGNNISKTCKILDVNPSTLLRRRGKING